MLKLWLANGWMPNNPRLPVLLYRSAVPPQGSDPAASFEELFRRNGWPPQWRNGVYPFHHYHSTAHEVLGFAAGHARLVLGGPGGREVDGRRGRCRRAAGRDRPFPPSRRPAISSWSAPIRRPDRGPVPSAPTPEMIARIARVPFPGHRSGEGAGGPLTSLWRVG